MNKQMSSKQITTKDVYEKLIKLESSVSVSNKKYEHLEKRLNRFILIVFVLFILMTPIYIKETRDWILNLVWGR